MYSMSFIYTILTVSAFLALVPATILCLRERPAPDTSFWAVIGVALAGPLALTAFQLSGPWHTGFSFTLWLIVTVSLVLFALVCLVTANGWRLSALLLPYLLVLSFFAAIWAHAPEHPMAGGAPPLWIVFHIFLSVAAYGLLTIASVAGLGVFLQERALKLKQRRHINQLLPSVVDSEHLEFVLLVATELLLALAILSGMGTLYSESHHVLAFDHKTILTVIAFLLIGLLLILRWRSGVRGRRAARLVLLAYLLLTLAYPGVKFVTDVLIG